MKIILCCNAGASTSMLVAKMQKLAPEDTITACSMDIFSSTTDADVVLLGPQIGFKLNEMKSKVNCPVDKIPAQMYGLMNAQGVLDLARNLVAPKA